MKIKNKHKKNQIAQVVERNAVDNSPLRTVGLGETWFWARWIWV